MKNFIGKYRSLLLVVLTVVATPVSLYSSEEFKEIANQEETTDRPFIGLFHDVVVNPLAIGCTLGAFGVTCGFTALAGAAAVNNDPIALTAVLSVAAIGSGFFAYLWGKATCEAYRKMWDSYFPKIALCKQSDKDVNALGYAMATGLHVAAAFGSAKMAFRGGKIAGIFVAYNIFMAVKLAKKISSDSAQVEGKASEVEMTEPSIIA